MSDLSTDELIARVERADGPSRDLDRLIGEAVDAPLASSGDVVGLGYATFTASLDAALTLVPKGWALYRIDQYNDRENPAWGWGVKLRCYERPDSGMSTGESRHSIAHALVIAALKARQPAPPPQEGT